MKSYILLLVILLLTLFTVRGLFLYAREQNYGPNQLLIKLKNDAPLQDILKKLNIKYKKIERLHTIVPIINKVKKDLKLEKTKNGKYLFSGIEYKNIKKIPEEELFKVAYKEMNEIERQTYRSYVVTFPKKTDIEKIILRLKSSPDIETVEKNQIIKILN